MQYALIAVHYAYRLIAFAGKYTRGRWTTSGVSLSKPPTYEVDTPHVARIDHLARSSKVPFLLPNYSLWVNAKRIRVSGIETVWGL